MAVSKDGKQRVVYRGGQWVTDETFQPTVKADTDATDKKSLNDASELAQTERDATRMYVGALKAAANMGPLGTGPVTGWALDALTPTDAEDSYTAWATNPLKSAGRAAIGRLVPDRTWNAHAHLKTVNAKVALANSNALKGTASNSDMALLRVAGMGPYKPLGENRRIVKQAIEDSGRSQARALAKAKWISEYGSTAAPGRGGGTFEKYQRIVENKYDRLRSSRRSNLPTPPPRTKKASGPVTFDMDGNIIE